MSAAPHLRPVPAEDQAQDEPLPLDLDSPARLLKTLAEMTPPQVCGVAATWPLLPSWLERPHDTTILTTMFDLAAQGVGPQLDQVRAHLAATGSGSHEVRCRFPEITAHTFTAPQHVSHLVFSIAVEAFNRIFTEGLTALLDSAPRDSIEEKGRRFRELDNRLRVLWPVATSIDIPRRTTE